MAHLRGELNARLLTLTAAETRLGLIEVEPSLEAILALSYDALPDDNDRRAFCCLGVFGGQPLDFDAPAMTAVWDAEEEVATDLRIALVDAGLLETGIAGGDEAAPERTSPVQPPVLRLPSRYSLHQVIATFAAARLAADPTKAQLSGLRHIRYYAGLVERLEFQRQQDDPETRLDVISFLASMDSDYPQTQADSTCSRLGAGSNRC